MKSICNLLKIAEMLLDIQDYDSPKAALKHGDDELVPSEVVYAVLDGENTMLCTRWKLDLLSAEEK